VCLVDMSVELGKPSCDGSPKISRAERRDQRRNRYQRMLDSRTILVFMRAPLIGDILSDARNSFIKDYFRDSMYN
jgi:hypothetical protein